MKKTRTNLARVLVVAMVVCLLACALLPTNAFAANQKVNDSRNGVLQVLMIYEDENIIYTASGTGFLINDSTLITCDHVTSFSDSELAAVMEMTGKSVDEIRSRIRYEVTVARDVTINATIVKNSYDMDWAILRMETSIQGRVSLPLRSVTDVKQTEKVYSIGFPLTIGTTTAVSTNTAEDVAITDGTVTKIADGMNIWSGETTKIVYTNCASDKGNSGGPLMDENGNVIGIVQGWARHSESATEVHQAVAIDEVIQVLDALGIAYNKAGDTPPAPTEEVVEPTVEPTEDPAPTVTTPKPPVPTTNTDDDKGAFNPTLIIVVAAVLAILVVIIVVVIVIAVAGKKKSAPAPVSMPPVQRPVPPPPMQGGFVPPAPVVPQAPTAAIQDAGETTVLSGDAGETTVLSKNVNGGTLIRKRTGETININAEQFVIGRERKSVNYCISDNSSISRNHVRLTVRNGVTYLTDLNAANGTSVNGVKAMPRQEIALKSGDKITLADEDLEYKI